MNESNAPGIDVVTVVQLLGEAVKPVREDVQLLSGKIDTLATHIQQNYYNQDTIKAMNAATDQKIAAVAGQVSNLETEMKSFQEQLAGQWEKWLVRAGLVASLAVNVFALIKFWH